VILLACAVEAELGFYQPRDGIETLITGVGPVEAACAITRALSRRSYRLLVNAGVAGAFGSAARVGDGVVVADDQLELGLEDGTPMTLSWGEAIVAKASSDRQLVGRLNEMGFAAVRGVTVAHVTSTEATAARLAARLGAQVESMEGFAALRAAELTGVPAIQIRGISNRCGDRETSGWDFAAGLAGLRKIARALFELV
jgi:futalosine hydrolase